MKIWVYWDDVGYKPAIIQLCHNIMHVTKQLNITFLNQYNSKQYIANIHPNFYKINNPAHRADYIRAKILHQHGGIYVDSDAIIFPTQFAKFDWYFTKLRKFETIFYERYGAKKPAIWFICSCAKSAILADWITDMEELLAKKTQFGWTTLNQLLWRRLETTTYPANAYLGLSGAHLTRVHPIGWEDAEQYLLPSSTNRPPLNPKQLGAFLMLTNAKLPQDLSFGDLLSTPTKLITQYLELAQASKVAYRLDLYFDAIYVINLKHDREKLARVKAKFSQIGIKKYHIFEAVNGASPNLDKYWEQYQASGLKTPWEKKYKRKHVRSRGALGCLLSHYRIISRAKKMNQTRILIFEDDILVNKDYTTLIKEFFHHMPHKWDMLYLGATQSDWGRESGYELNMVNKYFYRADISTFGTFAYAVNNVNGIYDEIMKHLEHMDKPVDRYYIDDICANPKFNAYAFTPFLFIADLLVGKVNPINPEKIKEYYVKYRWDDNYE